MNEAEIDSWINDACDIIKVTDDDVKNAISFSGFLKKGFKIIKNNFFKSKRSASMPSIRKNLIHSYFR